MKRFLFILCLLCTALVGRADKKVWDPQSRLWYEVNFDYKIAKVLRSQHDSTAYKGWKIIPDSIYVEKDAENNDSIYVKVTKIGNSAFAYSAVDSVFIPISISEIESSAFYGCNRLTKAIFNSLDDFLKIQINDEYANPLRYSKNLYIKEAGTGKTILIEDLIIPTSVTVIGNYAFCGCTGLKSVKMHGSIKSVGLNAFRNCTGLGKVIFPSIKDLCSMYYVGIESNPLYYAHHLFLGDNEQEETTIDITDDCLYEVYNSKQIRSYALAGASYIERIDLSAKLNYIGSQAFYGCTGLKYVNYKGGIDKVLQISFGDNPSNYAQQVLIEGKFASTLVIPDNITYIPAKFFPNAKWLEGVKLGVNVEDIRSDAFNGCSNLSMVVIPDDSKLKFIGDRAFKGCKVLEAPNLQRAKNIQSIGEEAFVDCNSSNFKSITLPDNCELGKMAFQKCTKLREVVLPKNLLEIPSQAFDGCGNLEHITMPPHVKVIGEYAFQNCIALKTLPISDALTTIRQGAFKGCTGLTSLAMSEKGRVYEIMRSAFDGCTSVTTVSLSDTIDYIYPAAFANCDNLKSVYCLKKTRPNVTSSEAFGSMQNAMTLYVPDSTALANYKEEEPWKSFGNYGINEIITLKFYVNDVLIDSLKQNSGTTIVSDSIPYHSKEFPADSIFSGWKNKQGNNVPTIMPVADDCFYGYISLDKTIGDYQYTLLPAEKENGKNLDNRAILTAVKKELTENNDKLTIPDSVKINSTDSISYAVIAIGPHAFENKPHVTKIILPKGNTIKEIGIGAFKGSSNLTQVDNMGGVTILSDSLFYGCRYLSDVDISNVKEVGVLAFGNCESFKNFPTAPTKIGKQAYLNCNLAEITIPKTLTTLDEEAFAKNRQLTKIQFEEGSTLSSIPKLAFWECTSLTNIKFSKNITRIKERAFEGCSSLTTLVLDSVQYIEAAAFKNCTGLASLTLPRKVEGIYKEAFWGCTKLSQITAEPTEPPFAVSDAFNVKDDDKSIKEYAYLFVYAEALNKYKTADTWRDFKNIGTQTTQKLYYQVDGKIVDSLDVFVGAPIQARPDTIKADHQFSGWLNEPEVMPAKDTTVVGNFQYELKFYENSVADANRLLNGPNDPKYIFYYGDKIVLPVEALNKPGFKYKLSGLTTEDIFEDDAANADITMPADDIDVIVTYEKAEADVVFNGINYRVYMLENRAEVVSGTEAKQLTISSPVTYDGKSYPVKTIRPNAFKDIKQLESITIATSVDSIGDQAFRSTSLKNVTIPSNVTKLGEEVFLYCTKLETVSVSANITTLSAGTFSECSNLKTVTLPNALTVIGERAFNGCSALKNLTLPTSVVSIGERAFWNVFGEEDYLTISGTTLPAAADNTFDDTAYHQATIKTSATNLTEPWNRFVHVESATGVNPCAAPVITYEINKLKLTCSTPNSTIYYKVTVDDNHVYSAVDNKTGVITLTKSFTVEAYATADNRTRSETTSETFNFETGDISGDGKISVTDIMKIVTIIQGQAE